MSAQTQQWFQKIDSLTKEFKDRFGDMAADELNQKPNAQTWSIAENLQHLITVNQSYFPMLEQVKDGKYKTPFLGRFTFYVNLMGKTILKSVSPESRKKIRTFPMWEPVAANLGSDTVCDFARHQDEFKNRITESKPALEKGLVISSPANGNIVYTLEKAFDIMIAHEERHLHQAMEAFEVIFKNQYKYDL